MKSTKSMESLKPLITTRKIKNLAKKALLDKPKHVPSKGMMFLEDKEIGSVFELKGISGLLIGVNESSAQVIILTNDNEDSTLVGKIRIGAKTEVFK